VRKRGEIPYRCERMNVCPWCKARNPPNTANAPCQKCGKRAADHPSVTGRTVDDGFGDDDVANAPALDLDLGTSRSMPGSTGQPLGREVGDGFGDDEDHAAPGGGLDLDLSGPTNRYVEPAPSQPKLEKPKEVIPQLKPQSAATIEIDPFEIKALADYGPEPRSIVQAVPYSIRVLRRQRELKRALAGVRVALKEAETKRDERMIELGTILKPIVMSHPDYASLRASLGHAEQLVNEREQALAQTNATFREKAAQVDAEIASIDPSLAAAKADVEAKRKAFEEADHLRQKHEARRKRVEIDVRAAQAKLAAMETPANDRAAAQSLIASANQERETRAAEEKLAAQGADKAKAALTAAESHLAQIEGQLDLLRKKRRALEQEFSRQGAVRTEGVADASKDVRNVLLEIGRKTWQTGPEVEGATMRRRDVADADARVKRLQVDLEKHVRALASADRNGVRNGLVILGATFVLVVGAFIAWRALRSNPYLTPDQAPRSELIAPSRLA